MFCTKCGSPLPSDSIFCPKCGVRPKPAKVCPHCKFEIPADATTCGHCRKSVPKPPSQAVCGKCGHKPQGFYCPKCGYPNYPAIIVCIVMGVFALAFFIWLVSPSAESPEEQRAKTQEDAQLTARAACQVAVKEQLKAPSVAKFGPLSETTIAKTPAGGWSVQGYVDSQNSFGAMIRSNYVCAVTSGGIAIADVF